MRLSKLGRKSERDRSLQRAMRRLISNDPRVDTYLDPSDFPISTYRNPRPDLQIHNHSHLRHNRFENISRKAQSQPHPHQQTNPLGNPLHPPQRHSPQPILLELSPPKAEDTRNNRVPTKYTEIPLAKILQTTLTRTKHHSPVINSIHISPRENPRNRNPSTLHRQLQKDDYNHPHRPRRLSKSRFETRNRVVVTKLLSLDANSIA